MYVRMGMLSTVIPLKKVGLRIRASLSSPQPHLTVGGFMQSKSRANRRSGTSRRASQRSAKDYGDYMVLRTVYMPPSLDNKLRIIAEKKRRSKNDIIREILSDAVTA